MLILSFIFLLSAIISGILGINNQTGIIPTIFTVSIVLFFVSFLFSTFGWVIPGGKHNG